MFPDFGLVKSTERRPALAAFGTLLGFTAAHATLETARDALFLARVSAARLPWVYLAIAAVSLGIALFADRRAPRTTSYTLAGWLLFSSVSVIALSFLVERTSAWVLYVLYVWSGVIATIVVTRFWILLGGRFTLTQAKRLYGFIGAGSVVGAIVGSAVARILTSFERPKSLLLFAAAAFAVSALGPVLVESSNEPAPAEHAPEHLNVALLFESPYARRIGLLVLCSTVALTLADYIFKTSVAAHVPKERLGTFFASVYLVFNVVSLAAQLLIVQSVVRVAGMSGALAVLPAVLIGGGFGLLVSGGLAMALLVKAADGALRYSLHRTVIELLFVPMSERLRAASKTLIDVLGQRGGQGLASLAILGALALGAHQRVMAASLIVVAALWIFMAYDLREHYVNLFRQTLRESASHPQLRFPGLDLSSLESVISALNSRNDAEVRAALQILAEDGRSRLIPALILYHPSPEVVSEALDILDKSGRRDFLPITDRLFESAAPEVRAAVLRLHNARSTDEALLRRLIAEDCPVLRATALVLLTRAGLATEVDQAELKALLHAPDDAPKIAIARAIAHNPIADFEDYLIELSTDRSIAVQNAVLAAMSASPTARYLPTLMRLLPRRELRQAARATLLSMGETALSFLAGALVDETRPAAQRRHLPRTIMRFGGQRAADLLLEQLPVEPDGVVRYKILRALTQMHNGDSAIHLSHAVLDGATDETARHVYQLIAWRFVLEQRRASQLQDSTQAHALLVRLLRDKQIHALDRLFLLLGLRFPKEDVAAIHRALQSRDAKVRSSGRELLENLLPPPKRTAILGLTDDVPDRERLLRAGAFAPNQPSDYEGVLQALLDTSSAVIRSLAVYHAAELGLSSLRPRIELLTRPEDGLLASVAQMAIDWFADLQRREAPARG